MMVSAKRKRVSKKSKLSWRKHVDIKDVEDFLEDKRLEERLGEKWEIRPDKDLFQIDTKPLDVSGLSSKKRKKLRAQTTPKCFALLKPLTNVPDPITKRNRVRTKEERRDRIAKKIDESRLLRGIVKAKDRQAEQNRKFEREKKLANKYQPGDFKNDIWKVEDFNPINIPDKEWLTNDTVRHNRHGLGILRKTIPKSLTNKTSVIMSVEAPHPGMSYNPSLKDHQALLHEVAQDEMKKIKEEKHIERVTTKMFKRVSQNTKDMSWLNEMSEGIRQIDKKNDDSDVEDGEIKSINPPVQNLKKDKKQRRKQKEQRSIEKKIKDAKIEKRKIADIYKLKNLNEEIAKQQKKTDLLKQKREKKKKYQIAEPKQLSKNKFQLPDLDFQMGEELSGNLQGLKPTGNLLKDRFKSLQKRNILEATVKQPPKKKPKYKKYERTSHKMGWEPKGF